MDDLKIWRGVSEESKDLVSKLLDKNPLTRLSISEALRHPWLMKTSIDDSNNSTDNTLLSPDSLVEENLNSMASSQTD